MKNSYAKMSLAELEKERDAASGDYLKLRMDKVVSHMDNPLALRNTRRKIARLNTLINEYHLGIRQTK
ncbi:MAG: 50S ribosomal protein L29 [Sphaerochaetaceae bacterium]|jgi:large subunit ribosomal protein L29|nr:50S ribosomal protein L29 [Sphaerochaetaceae bacterium]